MGFPFLAVRAGNNRRKYNPRQPGRRGQLVLRRRHPEHSTL